MHAPATAAAAIAAAAATAAWPSAAAIAAAATAPRPSGAAIAAATATATAAVTAAMAATAAAIAGTAMASRRPGSRPESAPPGTTAAAAGPMPITTRTTAPAATTDRDTDPRARRLRRRRRERAGARLSGWPPRSDAPRLVEGPVDDGAADRETESHPARLRGHERLENLVGLGGIDAVARVLDLDDGGAALSARPDAQDTVLGRRPGQGLDRVHQQVDDHLLDLIAMADRVHGLGGQLQTRRDVVRAQLPCDQAD